MWAWAEINISGGLLMRLFKRITAVGLVAAMTITGAGFTAMAGTFSDADSIWNGTITTKLYDSTKGNLNITDLQVPTLAYDDTSIGMVWEKPEQYANVADYNVYINGVKQADTARANFAKYADWTDTYMKAFYDYYNTQDNSKEIDMVNVDVHSYRATGLTAETEYTFSVVAVDKDGKEMGTAQTVKQKTTKAPEVFNIKDFGAETSEAYTSYDDTKNAFIVKNTKAIQAAIDACTPGGKVVVPEGTFVVGALWLKSNMTLEINGTLWASPNSDHFEIGFLMYPFYTDTRSWGIVNAVSSDPTQQLENIRITGDGCVNGNGWKFGNAGAIDPQGGLITNINKSENPRQSGDVDTTKAGFEKYALPRYVSGGNTKVFSQGILAADSAVKYLSNLTKEDGSKKYDSSVLPIIGTTTVNSAIEADDITDAYATRSSLVILRNINGVYIDDVTVTNPSNHTINILDSDHIAVNNVKALSFDNNNGDGIGFGCSKNVICWNNFCDTGDDTIGFGASIGKGAQDADIQTNSTLWIFNNFIREGHGGAIAAGSHTGNGIQDVMCEDNVINHSDMPFRFKSAPTTGGFISNITIRDCAVADSNQVFVLTTSYSDPNSASSTEYADAPGTFNNFSVSNVTAYSVTQNTICVYADVDPISKPEKTWHTHYNLYFQDVKFGDVGKNGGFKNYNGWETLTGCENAVFYDVVTTSYNSKAVLAGTDVAWSNIKYCKNIQFLGTTKTGTLNPCTTNMEDAALTPSWATDAAVTATSATDGKSVDLSWSAATLPNSKVVTYGVEVYSDNKLIDQMEGITGTTKTIAGLSAGVNYTFKVNASANNKSTTDKATCYAIVNKTAGPSASVTTTGTPDKTDIVAPATTVVTQSNPIYTCAQIAWPSALTNDARVRGYKLYVNGELNKTIYNYQIAAANQKGTISWQAGRLTPGVENTIQIVAFTDAGVEFSYTPVKVTTLKNYDFKSPLFAAGAAVTASKKANGDVTLSWPAATDDTAVSGYRVYVDGNPVVTTAGDIFNPVNGKNTTTETTYTVSGLDLTKDHTFTVQAGDTWWKAAQVMGSYDKMAGYNWTVNGISTTITANTTVEAAKITAGTNETITTEQVANAVSGLLADQDLVIDATIGSVGEITAETFEAAAAKGATVTIKGSNYTWEFANIPSDVAASFKSPEVTVGADVTAVTGKLSAAGIDSAKTIQLSFANSGVLPGEAKCTIDVQGKFAAGTQLYFYYFNPETGVFGEMQTVTVSEAGKVTLTLTHCSDYVLSAEELTSALTTAVTVEAAKAAQTGDTAPIMPIAMTAVISLGAFILLTAKKRRKVENN